MEVVSRLSLYGGILVTIILIIYVLVYTPKGKTYEEGKKTVGLMYADKTAYYRKKKLLYRIYSAIMILSCVISIFVSFVLIARPYTEEVVDNEKYGRDIIVCMDVSTSVNELNKKLVKELKDVVKDMNGERVGIVIFNTSPVLLVPLTDDYDYISEQLDTLEECFDMLIEYDKSGNLTDDYWYLYNYVYSGTLVGNAERGSSIIGDGLGASVYDFSDLEEDRSRVIIFSTDNDLYGDEIVSINEASDICKQNHVVVYGVGTKEMTDVNMENMRIAMENTGGKLYLEEDGGALKEVVKRIDKESKSLIKGDEKKTQVLHIKGAFIVLLISVFSMILFTKITKR